MTIHFTKMSGAGNDFVVADNRTGIITDPAAFARTVCDRRFGIGADGILLVERSSAADFGMRYHNADGSYGGMCGNGGRCIAKFAFDSGIVGTDSFSFIALNHIYTAARHAPDIYELQMKDPEGLVIDKTITLDGRPIRINFIDTGSPHVVVFLGDNEDLGELSSMDVVSIGRRLRWHEMFQPAGANINFIIKSGTSAIQIRTYERGVEDETLACGTGSIASALISALRFQWESPVSVEVRSKAILKIGFDRMEKEFKKIRLMGPANSVFSGTIEI